MNKVGKEPGWLPMRDAAARAGLDYESFRRLVKAGVFTRGVFSAATKKPPVWVREKEVDAFRSGGVPAVERAKRSMKKQGA